MAFVRAAGHERIAERIRIPRFEAAIVLTIRFATDPGSSRPRSRRASRRPTARWLAR